MADAIVAVSGLRAWPGFQVHEIDRAACKRSVGELMALGRKVRRIVRFSKPMRTNFVFGLSFVVLSLLSYGQDTPIAEASRVEKHGTCATVTMGPLGMAFIIDSRITETSSGKTRRYPGCKVILARPTILLAAVGYVDSIANADHWNSLYEASMALEKLPKDPNARDLGEWGRTWGETLIRHFN